MRQFIARPFDRIEKRCILILPFQALYCPIRTL